MKKQAPVTVVGVESGRQPVASVPPTPPPSHHAKPGPAEPMPPAYSPYNNYDMPPQPEVPYQANPYNQRPPPPACEGPLAPPPLTVVTDGGLSEGVLDTTHNPAPSSKMSKGGPDNSYINYMNSVASRPIPSGLPGVEGVGYGPPQELSPRVSASQSSLTHHI